MAHHPDAWLIDQLTSSEEGGPSLPQEDAYSLLCWAKAVRERKPVVLIGAGMSLNAQPVARWREIEPERLTEPKALTWNGLAERLREGLVHDGEERETDALWLAELYAQRYGRAALLREVRRAVPDHLLEPGEMHRCIFALDWTAILTTNYDDLIEQAHKKFRIPSRLRICDSDLDLAASAGREEELELIYLHGVLRRPESIVLSLEDYRKYAATHPGMLAKVRQLFTQHPVMLLGFSGVDPNFVQWSGWLEDLIKGHRNPWISLNVGKQVSRSRQTYWQGALEFISVSPAQIPQILRIMGEFRREMDPRTVVGHAETDIARAPTLDHLLNLLPQYLFQLGGALPNFSDAYERERLIEHALRRAFALRYGAEGESRWQIATGRPRPLDPQAPVIDHAWGAARDLTQDERLSMLRASLEKDWPNFLLIVARYVGPVISRASIRMDLLQELELLPSDTRKSLQLDLKIALLQAKIDREATREVCRVVDAFLLSAPPNVEQQRKVSDIVQRNLLRREAPNAEDSSDQSAQGLRRQAFFAVQAGIFETAARLYAAAAARSRDECEDLLVEWLTLISAAETRRAFSASSVVSPRPGRDLDEELIQRRRWLEGRIPDRIEWFRACEREAFAELVKGQISDVRRWRGHSTGGRVASSAGKVLGWLEDFWLSPLWAGSFAELHGQRQWEMGDLAASAVTLSRYGSPRLAEFVALEARKRRRQAIEPALIDALLQKGRWPAEWLSRAEALLHCVEECSREQLIGLGEWLHVACAEPAQFERHLVRGGALVINYEVLEAFNLLEIRHLSYMGPEALLLGWPRVRERLKRLQPLDRGHRSLTELTRLPWQRWLQTGGMSASDGDRVLFELLIDSHSIKTLNVYDASLSRALESVFVLIESETGPLLPLEGQAVGWIFQWLNECPFKVDSLQHTRTKLALRLNGLSSTWSIEQLIESTLEALGEPPSDVEGVGPALTDVTIDLSAPNASSLMLHCLAHLAEKLKLETRDSLALSLKRRITWVRTHGQEHQQSAWIEGIASLARRLLNVGTSHEACCIEAIRLCLELTPYALRAVLRRGKKGLEALWPQIQEQVTALFLYGSEGEEQHRQNLALVAMDACMQADPSEPLPLDWWDWLWALTHSADEGTEGSAYQLLFDAAQRGDVPFMSADIWRGWLRASRNATTDGRARIRGPAGYALCLVLDTPPPVATPAELNQIREILSQLNQDQRVGVQAELQRAHERIQWLHSGTESIAT